MRRCHIFPTEGNVTQCKKKTVRMILLQFQDQKLRARHVLSMNVPISFQVLGETTRGLPVPVIDFGCDLFLELCQFVLGEGSRQDLGPPLDQAVCHLLQLAEECDLVVLGWENEVEERTKNKGMMEEGGGV